LYQDKSGKTTIEKHWQKQKELKSADCQTGYCSSFVAAPLREFEKHPLRDEGLVHRAIKKTALKKAVDTY
jgi:hypothetical protein